MGSWVSGENGARVGECPMDVSRNNGARGCGGNGVLRAGGGGWDRGGAVGTGLGQWGVGWWEPH